jgi:hypothetical protein
LLTYIQNCYIWNTAFLKLVAYISLLDPTYIANFLAGRVGSADFPIYQSIYAMLIGLSSGAYLEAGASGF